MLSTSAAEETTGGDDSTSLLFSPDTLGWFGASNPHYNGSMLGGGAASSWPAAAMSPYIFSPSPIPPVTPATAALATLRAPALFPQLLSVSTFRSSPLAPASHPTPDLGLLSDEELELFIGRVGQEVVGNPALMELLKQLLDQRQMRRSQKQVTAMLDELVDTANREPPPEPGSIVEGLMKAAKIFDIRITSPPKTKTPPPPFMPMTPPASVPVEQDSPGVSVTLDDKRVEEVAPRKKKGGRPTKREKVQKPSESQSIDPEVLARREKDLQKGFATDVYKRFCQEVPKGKRVKGAHPTTPNKHRIMSRRSWDSQVRIWRRLLHVWADTTDQSEVVFPGTDRLPTKMHRPNN